MRKHLMGLAAAVAVAVSAAPAMAGCGGCGGYSSYSNYNYAGYGGGYSAGCGAVVSGCGASYGYPSYSYLPQQAVVYAAQPQYYYVNQGPTYTGPGMYAPVASYQQRAVGGWAGYGVGKYHYNGGPYANASHHYYNGAPAWGGPAVYSYRRAARPSVRYGYSQRSYRTPRVIYAPRYAAPRYAAPRYSVAPHQYHQRQRVLRRYN
ncbi:MAG: hypothetical protein EOP21_03255 [Hyphomicrobiales bacterium]|nr:MAG: hypothetical protein EOP21_03255 [Hyphomicrobiales bacterium]